MTMIIDICVGIAIFLYFFYYYQTLAQLCSGFGDQDSDFSAFGRAAAREMLPYLGRYGEVKRDEQIK